MNNWTREQTIIVLNLYCKIPFSKATSSNPQIVRISNLIGRSPNSVKMKIGNFGSLDNRLREQGIVGLSNASKLDKLVWEEFSSDWDNLAFESEKLIAELENTSILIQDKTIYDDIPQGKEREILIKQRVNQGFFRSAVLSSYNQRCCITGISIADLLIASHIVPWSVDDKNRTNPHNGLCLNSLHDRAFDKGLITITPDFRIQISSKIKEYKEEKNKEIENYFLKYENQKIFLPDKFVPHKDFLDYHKNNIFIK